MDSKTIILCATQRSGSTMIVEDMRASGVLGIPGEYLIGWSPEAGRNWPRAFTKALERGRGANSVRALKLMARQLVTLEACLAQSGDIRPAAPGPYAHAAAQLVGAHLVYICRGDTVKQAISREMAAQTGINHATAKADDPHFAGKLMRGYRDDYNAQVRYDFARLKARYDAIQQENAIWQQAFSDWRVAPQRILYEDYTKDARPHLEAMAAAAGVRLPAALPPRHMVKLANQVSAEWEARFRSDLGE